MRAANQPIIAGNTSRCGKNRAMEIGNAGLTSGIPISERPRPHLKDCRWPLVLCRTVKQPASRQTEIDLNELDNAHSHRATRYGHYRSSVDHLLRYPAT